MVTCYLGIGSNLGNRRENIKQALQKLNALKATKVILLSKIIETEPVGGPSGQTKFLNAALKIKTSIGPLILLKKLKEIEKELGRTNGYISNGPRTIDLDILFYGDKVMNRKDLKIPHPKAFGREFVTMPLWGIL